MRFLRSMLAQIMDASQKLIIVKKGQRMGKNIF